MARSSTAVRTVASGTPTRVVTVSVFHSTEERDGMLGSGMEWGLNETYRRLDALIEKRR